VLLAIGGKLGDITATEGQSPELWQLRGIAHITCGMMDHALDNLLRAAWLGKVKECVVPRVESVGRLVDVDRGIASHAEQLEFWEAAREGHASKLHNGAKRGLCVNWRNPQAGGRSALLQAASTGNKLVV